MDAKLMSMSRKLEQRDRFDSKTDRKFNYNATETVRKLVELWETSGKESSQTDVFCFGQALDVNQGVESPLKRRRIHSPLAATTRAPAPPRPWARAPSTPSGRMWSSSPSTRSPGTSSWRRRRPVNSHLHTLTSTRVLEDQANGLAYNCGTELGKTTSMSRGSGLGRVLAST